MTRSDWHLRSLLTSSLTVIFVRVAGIILQAVIILYLARVLTLEEMGYYAIAWSVLSLVRILGPLGSDQIAMREISNSLSQGAVADARLLSTTSLFLVLIANATLSVICLAIFLLIKNPTTLSSIDCFTISLAIPSFALNGLFAGQIRGAGKAILAQLPDSVGTQFIFMAGLGGLVILEHTSLSTVLGVLCLASWSITCVYALIRRGAGLYASKIPTKIETWNLARQGSSISQALIFSGLSIRAPVLLSALLLGPAATAVLEIAIRFGTLPSIITNSISSTFAPRFAILAKQNDSIGLYRAFLLAALLSFIPAILILVCFAAVIPSLLGWLLPAAYSQAYIPLLIIAAASALNGALGISGTVLIMADFPHPVRLFSLIRLVAIAMLCVVLGHSYGVPGMACAVFIATILRDGSLAIVAYQKLAGKTLTNGVTQ